MVIVPSPSLPRSVARLRRLYQISLRVLGFAVAEGPILLLDLDEVDEHVLAAHIEALVQSIGDGLVEGALLLERSSLVERQLDEDAVLGPPDTKVVLVGDEPVLRMLSDDLEAVVLRRIQCRDHGIVDDLADGAAIVGRLAPNEIDASERHAKLLSIRADRPGCGRPPTACG